MRRAGLEHRFIPAIAGTFFCPPWIMSYITAIGTANPPNKLHQTAIADFMIKAMQLSDTDARKLRVLYGKTGIESRYSVLADYGKKNGFDFFANSDDFEPFPSTKKRLDLFREHSLNISLEAIAACLLKRPEVDKKTITHLIVVSCTGMYAPGLDIDLVNALQLTSSLQRLCINFMGCYAAFNALKLADSFCETQPAAKVLVVCTELCSIHFQKKNNENNILANALFADGSACLLVESTPRKGLNLRPESFFCDLLPEGGGDMAWTVGDAGFEMKLTSYVPGIIRSGIKKLTQALLANIAEDFSNVSYFAIHPGGKKILEVIEQELGLAKEHNRHAYAVLKKYGNMSSPTVLFVLNEVCQTLNGVDDGKKILSFAFGPGLTLESMLLKIENH
jgi:predicted naringenin-chalcone synthase